MTTRAIYFDMDGTIANLYGVDNWLDMLRAYDSTPYEIAKPLVNMNSLARLLNNLQAKGYKIGIVSWLSKVPNSDYDMKVTNAKIKWLSTHLKSVKFDEIHIVAYGTPKSSVVKFPNGILFDDERNNRMEWNKASDNGIAFDVNNIIKVLKGLA